MKRLIIAIDMVNGFVNEGALSDKNINRIVPNVEKLIKMGLNNNDTVVAFRDCHETDDIEFKDYPPHCIKGTKESELVKELKKYEKDMVCIDKPTTNGFVTKQFFNLITKNEFDQIIVSGCCTDICVNNFLKSLHDFLSKTGKNTSVYVAKDAIDTFNAPGHNADEINQKYLKKFEQMFGTKNFELTKGELVRNELQC